MAARVLFLCAGILAAAPVQAEVAAPHVALSGRELIVDRAEWVLGAGADALRLDAQAWFGDDRNRLWLKAWAGLVPQDGLEGMELQALYGRSVSRYWNVELGVRQDVGPGPERTHLVLGAHGLSPFWFEAEAVMFLSTRGELTALAGASYDLELAPGAYLQPTAEVQLAAQDVDALGLRAGFTGAELGVRLRYELSPAFAPYAGVSLERLLGGTARLARDVGEDTGRWAVVLGVRSLF